MALAHAQCTALDRPCSLQGNVVGVCKSGSSSMTSLTCSTQCSANTSPNTACFLTATAQTRDGSCLMGSCVARSSACMGDADCPATAPKCSSGTCGPAPSTSCTVGRPCAIPGTAVAGECQTAPNSQTASCVAICSAMTAPGTTCFVSLMSSTRDGTCVQGSCSATSSSSCTVDRPCALQNNALGVCQSGSSMNTAPVCAAQCSTTSTASCYLSATAQTRDGVCAMGSCVARTSSCTVGRPCAIPGSAAAGECQAGPNSPTASCVAICSPMTAPGTTCFVSLMSSTRDGTCVQGSCSATSSSSCTVDRPCALQNNALGVCQSGSMTGSATCSAQCSSSSTASCYLSFTAQTRDGSCVNGECRTRTNGCMGDADCPATAPKCNSGVCGPAPSTSCTVGRPCSIPGSAVAGECQTAPNSPTASCVAICSPMTAPGTTCFVSLMSSTRDGTCVQGSCSRTSSSSCTVDRPCSLQNNVVGVCQLSNSMTGSATCSAQCSSSSTTACFLTATAQTRDGSCVNGECRTRTNGCMGDADCPATAPKCNSGTCGPAPSTSCTVGRPCAIQGSTAAGACQAAPNSPSSAVCSPICSQTTAPGTTCFVSLMSSTLDGTCVQGSCSRTSSSSCTVDRPCSLQNNVVGECQLSNSMTGSATCSAQCSSSSATACFLTATAQTRDGSCVNGACRVRTNGCMGDTDCPMTAPKCNAGTCGPAMTQCTVGASCDSVTNGKFDANCRCIASPTANCKVGDRCTSMANNDAASGTFDANCRCVVGGGETMATSTATMATMAPINKCVDGQTCAQPGSNSGGVCRRGVCVNVECQADVDCAADSTAAARVCQNFACIAAPTKADDPCVGSRACQNGGKCVVVDAARAGLTQEQTKMSVDVNVAVGVKAAVCVCAAGFKGALCETTAEQPVEQCKCVPGQIQREGRCVVANQRVCECSNASSCVCTKDNTANCTPAPQPMATGQVKVLTVVFGDRASLLQALGLVQQLLSDKNIAVTVSAELLPGSAGRQAYRVTVSTSGAAVTNALLAQVGEVADTLRQRSDVVDAVVQEAKIDNVEPDDNNMRGSAAPASIALAALIAAATALAL